MSTQRTVTMKGKPLVLSGQELKVGDYVPNFKLTANDMTEITLDSLKGKVLVISTVPSLDTPVCAIETKRFNEEAGKLSSDVTVLTLSLDLPFALKRFCLSENIERVVTASDYKQRCCGESFGVYIPEIGLYARAVFVVDRSGKIIYTEYVSELGSEPDYSKVIEKVKSALSSS